MQICAGVWAPVLVSGSPWCCPGPPRSRVPRGWAPRSPCGFPGFSPEPWPEPLLPLLEGHADSVGCTTLPSPGDHRAPHPQPVISLNLPPHEVGAKDRAGPGALTLGLEGWLLPRGPEPPAHVGPSFPFPHVVTGPQWLHPLPCPTKRLALRSVSHTSRGGNHTKSLALGGLGADLCSAHHGGALWGGWEMRRAGVWTPCPSITFEMWCPRACSRPK